MEKYLDGNDKKNEIRLMVKHPLYKNKAIIMVEGKTDIQLYRKMIHHEKIKIESIDGKKSLLELVEELYLESQILGICDADYDHLTGEAKKRLQYSIIVTDVHDAEMMMLTSPSLNSFFKEYSSNENIDELEKGVFVGALEVAYVIGLARWASIENTLNINFKGLNYGEFIGAEKVSININTPHFINTLMKRSKDLPDGVKENDIKEYIEQYQIKSEAPLQVCCGHDVTNIIALVYRQSWASIETNMTFKKIETALRLGYQLSYFNKTTLYENLTNKLSDFGIQLDERNKPTDLVDTRLRVEGF